MTTIVPIHDLPNGDRYFTCPACRNNVGFAPAANTYSVTCPCGQELSLAGHCLTANVPEATSRAAKGTA